MVHTTGYTMTIGLSIVGAKMSFAPSGLETGKTVPPMYWKNGMGLPAV